MQLFLEPCDDPFIYHRQKSSSGAVGIVDVATLDGCKTACLVDNSCIGLDWVLSTTVSVRCWLHKEGNEARFAARAHSSLEDQYELQQDCLAPTDV